MPCLYPLTGWKGKKLNANGKRPLVFKRSEGYNDLEVQVSCGQCIGCRLEKSRQWAVRMVHEASMHEDNIFITLTYAPEHLPTDGTLVKEHFQKFMKRLRKRFPREKGDEIRYFHCGEYGDKLGRPHYHGVLFNFKFPDQYLFTVRSPKGVWNATNVQHRVFRSQILETLWPFGLSEIGSVTFESCAYVARYVTKKITGDKALEHYCTIDRDTGEILTEKIPEYCTMSLKPAIGRGWFEKYKGDCFPKDFLTVNGNKVSVPKYYDVLFDAWHPEDFKDIKLRREREAKLHEDERSVDRLIAKEKIKNVNNKQLKRGFENAQA